MITGTTGASAPFVCSAARDVAGTQRFSSTSQRRVGRESWPDARLALLHQLTPMHVRPANVARHGPESGGDMYHGLLGWLHSLDEHPNGAARGQAGGLYAFVVAKPHDG